MLRAALGLLLALGLAQAEPAGPLSTCLDCHRSLKVGAQPAHGFAAWRASPHAAAGVSCEACHAGDPSARDKAAAHAGVLPAADAGSLVHSAVVSDTCGICHVRELRALRRGPHGEARSAKMSPDCVTCHGALGQHAAGPREREALCARCHRKPALVPAALPALEKFPSLLSRRKAANAWHALDGFRVEPRGKSH